MGNYFYCGYYFSFSCERDRVRQLGGFIRDLLLEVVIYGLLLTELYWLSVFNPLSRHTVHVVSFTRCQAGSISFGIIPRHLAVKGNVYSQHSWVLVLLFGS